MWFKIDKMNFCPKIETSVNFYILDKDTNHDQKSKFSSKIKKN